MLSISSYSQLRNNYPVIHHCPPRRWPGIAHKCYGQQAGFQYSNRACASSSDALETSVQCWDTFSPQFHLLAGHVLHEWDPSIKGPSAEDMKRSFDAKAVHVWSKREQGTLKPVVDADAPDAAWHEINDDVVPRLEGAHIQVVRKVSAAVQLDPVAVPNGEQEPLYHNVRFMVSGDPENTRAYWATRPLTRKQLIAFARECGVRALVDPDSHKKYGFRTLGVTLLDMDFEFQENGVYMGLPHRYRERVMRELMMYGYDRTRTRARDDDWAKGPYQKLDKHIKDLEESTQRALYRDKWHVRSHGPGEKYTDVTFVVPGHWDSCRAFFVKGAATRAALLRFAEDLDVAYLADITQGPVPSTRSELYSTRFRSFDDIQFSSHGVYVGITEKMGQLELDEDGIRLYWTPFFHDSNVQEWLELISEARDHA